VTAREDPSRFPVAIAVAAALVVALAIWLARHPETLGFDTLTLSVEGVEKLVDSWGAWGVAGSLLLMVLHSFVPVPAEVIAIANGLCFGLFGGIAVTWSGGMLGAASAFALARGLGRPLVCRLVTERRRARVDGYVRSPGALLLLRLIPVVSFNLVNYAAGLAGAGWWTFLWTTALGILPMTILTALLGSRIVEISGPVWLAIGAAVIVLWLAGRWLWDRWSRRDLRSAKL
jgi:uncharacterized membrane protein YdjX (TVP38/TMEM64 family)